MTRPSPSPGRIVAVVAAVVLPALLAVLFWKMTPIAGGWPGAEGAGMASAAPGNPAVKTMDPQALFKASCAKCHGEDLDGTATAPALKREAWPYAGRTDALVKIIHEGKGLAMPGFDGRLSNQQIEALAKWLQGENGTGPGGPRKPGGNYPSSR